MAAGARVRVLDDLSTGHRENLEEIGGDLDFNIASGVSRTGNFQWLPDFSAQIMLSKDKKIRAMLLYPMSSGRNFDEVLRLLDSVQLTESKGVATPVNWKPGDSVIIPPSVSDEDAKTKYPGGWETVKPYLRRIPQPQD